MQTITNTNLLENAIIIPTHINEIEVGDTIWHDGDMRTVCRKYLKHGGFSGTTVFGDNYNLGYTMVRKIIFTCNK